MSVEQAYIGQELNIFAHAINWKKYYSAIIRPYLGRRVVEVGAGIGATTLIMCGGNHQEWICLEPDPALRSEIDHLIAEGKLPAFCRTRGGFVSDIPLSNSFDAFIYIDVLEHIEDDLAELERAAARLSPGGRLVVLSPAFNFLYSPFDRAIGHHRRYDGKMLRVLTPPGCRLEKLIYLDSVGMATSLVNRYLLSQSMPTTAQIKFWDANIVPISKMLDPLLGNRLGRSILGIWCRT